MVSKPVSRPTTALTGSAAVVCLAGALLAPVSLGTESAAPAVHLAAHATPVSSGAVLTADDGGGGAAGAPGSSGDTSATDGTPSGVRPSHNSGNSSSSGGSTDSEPTSNASGGFISRTFDAVGDWLSGGSKAAGAPKAEEAPASAEQEPATGGPKPAKPDSGSASAPDAPAGAPEAESIVQSVLSGVSKLLGGLFGG